MTTDKRAAAIAVLGGLEKARELLRGIAGDKPPMPGVAKCFLTNEASRAIVTIALAALEADDGRALLIELRKWVWRNVDPADGMNNILAEIDRLLASAPEQPAPEPAAPHADDEANAGTSGKGRTDGRVQEVRRQADHLPPVFPGEQVSRRVPDIQVQRGSVADDAASGNECVEERAAPAQPDRGEPERVAHADDEARIAEWCEDVCRYTKRRGNGVFHDYCIMQRHLDEAVAIMRSLAAGKAKAEAEVERWKQRWQDDCAVDGPLLAKDSEIDELKTEDGNLRARLADATADIERMRGHIGSLRAKLAEAERERDDLREQVGDKGFSLLQQERDEAVADMLSVAQQVGIFYEAEGHAPKAGPTPAILRAIAAMQRDADDAPRLRSAGVSLKYKLTEATAERDAAVAKLAEAEKRLTTAMCNVAEAEDERNDARSSCFAAKAERDAALAAQNARAGLLGRAVEAISECLPDEDLNDLSTHFHMECKRHHFERLKDVRDEMECALRAAKPEPAAEPVPAAADAKPGDARRSLVQQDHNCWTPELSMAIIDAIDGLDERLRALEVRP